MAFPYHGRSWYIIGVYGISWNIIGIVWELTVYHGISWEFLALIAPGYTRLLPHAVRTYMYWYIPVYTGICWYISLYTRYTSVVLYTWYILVYGSAIFHAMSHCRAIFHALSLCVIWQSNSIPKGL
jgi:hypothetical protein